MAIILSLLEGQQMKGFLILLVLISVATQGFAFPGVVLQPAGAEVPPTPIAGRWRVKFSLAGIGEKNLIFAAQVKGSGSFTPLDTEPGDKPVADPLPAAWSETTNARISFSGEVELPFGTCCRETGTLIFKGKFESANSISGRAIFVGSSIDEENFNGFRSTVGTFTATRVIP